MDSYDATFALYALGAAAVATSLIKLKGCLDLSRAKHPSLAGHSRIARRIASLIPHYEYDEARFFRSDDPPEEVATRRRAGLMRLSAHYQRRFARTVALTADVK